MISESLCEFDASLGFKICKCLSGFEEVSGAQNQLYCAPIRPTQATSSSSTVSTVEENVENEVMGTIATVGHDANGNEDVVEIFSESPQEERDARMRTNDTDFQSLVLKLGKNNQIGLMVFGGVILMAVLLVVIIIRSV